MVILKVSLIKINIGTFRSYVKIRWAEPKPKHKQRNSYKLPDHRKRIIYADSLLDETEK